MPLASPAGIHWVGQFTTAPATWLGNSDPVKPAKPATMLCKNVFLETLLFIDPVLAYQHM